MTSFESGMRTGERVGVVEGDGGVVVAKWSLDIGKREMRNSNVKSDEVGGFRNVQVNEGKFWKA